MTRGKQNGFFFECRRTGRPGCAHFSIQKLLKLPFRNFTKTTMCTNRTNDLQVLLKGFIVGVSNDLLKCKENTESDYIIFGALNLFIYCLDV